MDFNLKEYLSPKNLQKDLASGLVVFLVALPLCLGIALASGAPLFAGIITGIIGGIVVGAVSGSQLSVSGPAAGLTVIVFSAIASLGSYQVFLLAVMLAGAMQILLSIVKAGTIANYFPSSVIEGMLAAIGIILIIKQLPHAVGYDGDFDKYATFTDEEGGHVFLGISHALGHFNMGAALISLVAIAILIFLPRIKKLSFIPAPLLVVISGIAMAKLFAGTPLMIGSDKLVNIPEVANLGAFFNLFQMPDFSAIGQKQVWITAATIAVVASLESLLCLEACDKMDPIKRVSPTNRELFAQGTGNIVSALVGGLPMTSVIVRSSANINSGARTKMSAIFHGVLLLLSVLFIPFVINSIPLSCLAAILLLTGYKLAKISLFRKMWKNGRDQFIPFVVTVVAVVFSDLLTGVTIGMMVGIFYILRTNLRNPYFYTITPNGDKKVVTITLSQEVSFLNKAAIQYTLTHLPEGVAVVIDGSQSRYIDLDVLEILHNFKENAASKQIDVQLVNIKEYYVVPKLDSQIVSPQKN